MKHEALTTELQERASLFAFGMLDPGEAAALEGHLAECPICHDEVRAFLELSGELALTASPATPSPAVRQKLLHRAQPDPVRSRASEAVWQPTPFEGVEVRRLFFDPVSGNVTQLVRVKPGAKYPPHHHAAQEHCYVLEGDLVFDDHTLHAGDYEVNPPGSDHSFVTSTTGCIALIINNVADRVLTA